MKINIISESEFFPKNHGVHTAYLNHVSMLKIVVSAHVMPSSFEGSYIGAKYWSGSARKYLKFFYNKADLVLAVAPKVKLELRKIGVTQRIEIFPNAIDTVMFRRDEALRSLGRKRFRLDKDKKVILGVGQVQPRKGISYFIKIAKELPEFTFIWVGDKPFKGLTAENEELRQLLRYPPKNFISAGGFPYSKMPQVYNAADIFFFPSFQENASMSIIEAASCGLPLILRDLEEYRLLYKEGYLSARKSDEFKKHIQRLFSNKNLFEQQRKESFNLARKFSYEALGNKLLNYYQDL